MKKLILLLIAVICSSVLQGQNIIPNGDFEIGPDSSSAGWHDGISNACSVLNTTTPGPTFWTVRHGTPDRMVYGDIPCNWDNDTAASGKAYIVLIWWEAGKATLTEALEKDSAYELSYYTILNTFRHRAKGPCGIYFKFTNTNDSIFSPLISDSTKWVYHDTTFIAGANATEIEIWGWVFVSAGANIDRVSLQKVKLTSVNNYSINHNIKVYPNPTTGNIYFNYLPINTKKIEINDLLGQAVMIYDRKSIINNSIDLSSLHPGTYILSIETTEDKFTKLILLSK